MLPPGGIVGPVSDAFVHDRNDTAVPGSSPSVVVGRRRAGEVQAEHCLVGIGIRGVTRRTASDRRWVEARRVRVVDLEREAIQLTRRRCVVRENDVNIPQRPAGIDARRLQASGCLVTVEREREFVDREGRTAARHRNGDMGPQLAISANARSLIRTSSNDNGVVPVAALVGVVYRTFASRRDAPGANVWMQTR